MSRIEISPRRLAWAVRCERRLWLDRHGNPALQVGLTLEARERAEQAHAHVEASAAAIAPAQQIAAGSSEEQLAATLALMRQGAAAIRGGVLAAHLGERLLLRGAIDLLLRREAPSGLGPWSYVPMAIKLHGEPRREDWLQLDAYRYLVGAAQDRLPMGELWLGRDGVQPQSRLEGNSDLASFTQAWRRVVALARAREAPPIWFERSCIFCPWRSDCQQRALARQELTLLPGLDRRAATALWASEITTVGEVATLSAEQLYAQTAIGHGRGKTLLSRAQALTTGRAVALNQPQASKVSAEAALFFDVESHPVSQKPWAFGWIGESGSVTVALIVPESLGAGNAAFSVESTRFLVVDSVAAAWRELRRAIPENGPVVHWGDYERMLLRSAPDDVRDVLQPRFQDAHRLLAGSYALPLPRTPSLHGNSLKAVGAWLGVEWPEGGEHWRVAWRAFQEWRLLDTHPAVFHHRDTETQSIQWDGDFGQAVLVLRPIARYLGADLQALALAWAWLREMH